MARIRGIAEMPKLPKIAESERVNRRCITGTQFFTLDFLAIFGDFGNCLISVISVIRGKVWVLVQSCPG
jgi:hypothetical protein